MIVDCHGHYTTAPQALWDWRKKQSAGQKPDPLKISDDEIRESIESNQLKLQKERGYDLTFFSPRAGSSSRCRCGGPSRPRAARRW